jgi:ABC-2 type transport system permease protein
MAIREQGYRHWEGTHTGHGMRWWTLAKTGLRVQFSSTWRTALLIIFITLAWLYPAANLIILSLTRGQGFDANLFKMYFQDWQWVMAFLTAALIGSGLVANDLRSNALHVYLSKPLRRADYIAGKAATIFIFMSFVTIFPALLLYLGGLLTTNELTRPDEPWKILGMVLLFNLILMLSISALILAFSSLAKKWPLALTSWIGFILIPDIIAGIASDISNEDVWLATSYHFSLFALSDRIYANGVEWFDWRVAAPVVLGLTLVGAAVVTWRIFTLEVSD